MEETLEQLDGEAEIETLTAIIMEIRLQEVKMMMAEEEAVEEVEEEEDQWLASNAIKKDICLGNAQILKVAEEVEEDHVLNVEKKATCLENVQKKEQTVEVEEEEVEADLKPALNVVRKDICQENAPRKMQKVEEEEAEEAVVQEPALNVEKKVTWVENAQKKGLMEEDVAEEEVQWDASNAKKKVTIQEIVPMKPIMMLSHTKDNVEMMVDLKKEIVKVALPMIKMELLKEEPGVIVIMEVGVTMRLEKAKCLTMLKLLRLQEVVGGDQLQLQLLIPLLQQAKKLVVEDGVNDSGDKPLKILAIDCFF